MVGKEVGAGSTIATVRRSGSFEDSKSAGVVALLDKKVGTAESSDGSDKSDSGDESRLLALADSAAVVWSKLAATTAAGSGPVPGLDSNLRFSSTWARPDEVL